MTQNSFVRCSKTSLSCTIRNHPDPCSLREPDAEQMKIPTLRLKGSASLIGARQVVEACTRLEAAAGANDWPMIQSLMPCLDGLMQHIETSANALRGLLPDPCR